MKKYLIIGGLCCITTIPSAMAVTKCVNLSTRATECAEGTVGLGANWEMNCKTGSANVLIRGVGVCSSKGGSDGDTASDIPISDKWQDEAGGYEYPYKYCWCKMVSPAVSQWVYVSGGQGYTCHSYCSAYCAQKLPSLLSSLFSNLSD